MDTESDFLCWQYDFPYFVYEILFLTISVMTSSMASWKLCGMCCFVLFIFLSVKCAVLYVPVKVFVKFRNSNKIDKIFTDNFLHW